MRQAQLSTDADYAQPRPRTMGRRKTLEKFEQARTESAQEKLTPPARPAPAHNHSPLSGVSFPTWKTRGVRMRRDPCRSDCGHHVSPLTVKLSPHPRKRRRRRSTSLSPAEHFDRSSPGFLVRLRPPYAPTDTPTMIMSTLWANWGHLAPWEEEKRPTAPGVACRQEAERNSFISCGGVGIIMAESGLGSIVMASSSAVSCSLAKARRGCTRGNLGVSLSAR